MQSYTCEQVKNQCQSNRRWGGEDSLGETHGIVLASVQSWGRQIMRFCT